MKKNIFSKKVEKIFFEFDKKQAKIWNIGTNVYMTWYRLNKNLSQNNLNNIVEIKIKEVPNPNKDKKYKLKPTKYGIIKANGINITPAKGKKHFAWSEAGIRQFLQEGSAMNIVMYNENNSVFNNFKVTAEFNNIFGSNKIDQSWWLNKIKNLILNSLISCQKHIVNLGFTLFYVLVCKIYPNIFTNFKNNYVLSYCVGRSNTNKTWKIKSNESIKEANRMYSEKNTYKDLVDIILDNKDKENIFLQILDDVYNIIFSEDENDEIKNIACDDLRLNEILRKLEEFRSHFRSELLTNRQKQI